MWDDTHLLPFATNHFVKTAWSGYCEAVQVCLNNDVLSRFGILVSIASDQLTCGHGTSFEKRNTFLQRSPTSPTAFPESQFMTDAIDHDVEASIKRMDERRSQFIAVLPDELKQREDRIVARLRSKKASVKAKLGQIYALVDEFAAHRAPFVARRSSWASCCHMNVQISSIEASRIEVGTGRRAKVLPSSIPRKAAHFFYEWLYSELALSKAF
jgi:hypothetical protein